MLDSFLVSILVGTVLGILTGLGTGGGSLLILWLTLVLDMEPALSRNINLMFFLPSALIATVINLRRGHIPLQKLVLPTVFGCLVAAAFALWARNTNTEPLKKLFGVLLIYVGIRELLYRPRNPK